VKGLADAKARLAPLLDEAARRELVLALFRDVVAACLASQGIESVAAVTRDPDVAAAARESGADVLRERGGLNVALTSAAARYSEHGDGRIVIVAADIPFATGDDLAAVAGAEADVVIVPSMDGGTSALAFQPGRLPLQFGPDSARLHEEVAHRLGLTVERLDLPNLAFDIDTPQHLAQLARRVEEGHAAGSAVRTALTQLPSLSNTVVRNR
jgi:2-phospho-L-lactate guanylyltransferase